MSEHPICKLTRKDRKRHYVEFVDAIPKLLTLPNIVAVLLFYGTAYQIGYFAPIGIEFLSMGGPQDWLFAVGYIAIVVGISFTIFVVACFLAAYRPAIILILASWKLMAAALGACLLASLILPHYHWLVSVLFLALMSTGAVSIIATFAIDVVTGERSHFFLITGGAFASALFVLISGIAFQFFSPGRECTIITTDNKFEHGRYMRSLGDGHLFRQDGNLVFIPKDKVFQMICKPDIEVSNSWKLGGL